jgi:hypothetical protein
VTTPDGVDFDECYVKKVVSKIQDINVYWMDLENLKKKQKGFRAKQRYCRCR